MASHPVVSTRRRICKCMCNVLQLTCDSEQYVLLYTSPGEAVVTRRQSGASAATIKTLLTPRNHTPHTATKQHKKLHGESKKLLWYVFHEFVGAKQRILTWSCRLASFVFTARLRPPT